MSTFRFSFSNYYARNIFAYLIAMSIALLPFLGGTWASATRTFFPTFIYYSFIFLLVIFHNKILLDKILLKRKIVFYIPCMGGLYFVWLTAAKLYSNQTGYPLDHIRQIFLFIIDLALGVSVFLSTRYMLEKQQFYQTGLLKRDMELQQLKTQLNPHFLFNALNNIYSYTLHSNKFGNDLILKLSELMRFILESSDKEIIPIANEINFIENYISFEKERLGERCIINYTKNILFGNRKIAPLILFPFVENAFKYGANTIQKTSVEIALHDTTDFLKLVVKNSIINKGQHSTKKGLPNATRRLELLYPQQHNLLIETTEELFIVELTLNHDKNKSADR